MVLLLATTVGYKIFLFVFETDYVALNAEHIDQIEQRLKNQDQYQFAVIGNMNNSLQIFTTRFLPLVKQRKIAFIISVGNAVFDGEEDKYRLLYRNLKDINIPYLLTAGPNEMEDFGAGKFYRHFGPYFFSFHLNTSYFIFLDSTGKTAWKWQLRWLKEELTRAEKFPHKFVFLNHAVFPLPDFSREDSPDVLQANIRNQLRDIFSNSQVQAVFSGGYPTFHDTLVSGVRYIITGGGGGLLLEPQDQYQFVTVAVEPERVGYENVPVLRFKRTFLEKLETVKLFLHSLFYMSLINYLFVLSVLSLTVLKIYLMLNRQKHLYRDFDVDAAPDPQKPLRIAMFTNNYRPFIGGVPLSIQRLAEQLEKKGQKVKIFAPTYAPGKNNAADRRIFRCPTLFYTRRDTFPVVNVFSPTIEKEFTNFKSDLVHVHHPFWLGKKGLHLAKKYGLPVIFTYHTRLELYTHYIPLPGKILKTLCAHFMIKHFANQCNAVITPTNSTEEYLRNLGVSSLIETIPTGINLAHYTDWSAEQIREIRQQYLKPRELLFISVSRLAKEKNLDFLIEGLARVNTRSQASFHCLLIGDGPEKERLKEKAASLNLNTKITFMGPLDPLEVVRFYLAADLFVFASTSETQGMVLLEAMAGGCPVVAVRSSGVYDVIRDGFNGCTVNKNLDHWAQAVTDLLENESQRLVMATNSREFAREYSVDKITEKVTGLYQRVLRPGHAYKRERLTWNRVKSTRSS